jgi:hypothetical protein
MRALLAGSASAGRLLVPAIAGILAVAVLAFGHAATAGDDIGLRHSEFHPWSEETAPRPRLIGTTPPAWPLDVTLDRHARVGRVALLPPVAQPQVVFPRRSVLQGPARPTSVPIYQDGTLRNGDAVMMADGIHVFHGAGTWPFQPRNFVRLSHVASLDWHFRQSLVDLDRNPPTRWTSIEAPSG